MLTIAWIFMGIAILGSGMILGDLKHEIEYNNKNESSAYALIITKGEQYGLQKTDYREDRIVLRRCS